MGAGAEARGRDHQEEPGVCSNEGGRRRAGRQLPHHARTQHLRGLLSRSVFVRAHIRTYHI